MSDELENQTFLEKQITTLRNAASIFGFIGGVCFITGYIIVNLYLSQFGVNYLNLIQARYLSTGILYIVMVGFVFIGPLTTYVAAKNAARTMNKRKLAFLILVNVVVIIAMIWVSGLMFTEVGDAQPMATFLDARKVTLWFTLTISLLVLVFPFMVLWLIDKIMRGRFSGVELGNNKELAFLLRMSFGGLFLICFIISLLVFSIGVYPNTTPTLGGGAPTYVQLLFPEGQEGNLLDLDIVNGLSEPILLIDQTGDKLLLLTENNQIVEISSTEILAIVRNKK